MTEAERTPLDAEVRDNVEQSRFEIRLADVLVGLTDYHDRGQVRSFIHTEIADGHGGQGLATHLIRRALDQTRAKGFRVRPICPFVREFIERHSDYADLVITDMEQ